MFALRFASLFLLLSTTIVFAIPAPTADLAVVDKHTVTAVDKRAPGQTITVTPLITAVTLAFETATSSFALFSGFPKRQTPSDIATLVAGIITQIIFSIDTLIADDAPPATLGTLDVVLRDFLQALETLLPGVLDKVNTALANVIDLLKTLNLQRTFDILSPH
ncbi:hypothetical protein B0H19DRAFT_1067423 [Mycena capillaripes]|nr:hypothetical protein B0H19DRAFT_1067423 [Mycena capillaripes]